MRHSYGTSLVPHFSLRGGDASNGVSFPDQRGKRQKVYYRQSCPCVALENGADNIPVPITGPARYLEREKRGVVIYLALRRPLAEGGAYL